MPPKKSKQKKKGSPSKSSYMTVKELDPSCTSYYGPVTSPSTMSNTKPNTILLIQEMALSSSGAGVINATFAKDIPTSCTDWSNLDSTYDQYRVLALEVKYFPNQSSGSANTFTPLLSVVDRDVITPLASYAAAANYDSLKEHVLDRPFKRTMKMSGTQDGVFLDTLAVPSASGAIKFFATGLTNSVSYGRVIVYYLIQFRGRGQ